MNEAPKDPTEPTEDKDVEEFNALMAQWEYEKETIVHISQNKRMEAMTNFLWSNTEIPLGKCARIVECLTLIMDGVDPKYITLEMDDEQDLKRED
ncbi:MAG TPA: hypothetical protein PKD55_02550 [Bellilinea sp.]|nr:hypothetical protein [Bellilinea sp.]